MGRIPFGSEAEAAESVTTATLIKDLDTLFLNLHAFVRQIDSLRAHHQCRPTPHTGAHLPTSLLTGHIPLHPSLSQIKKYAENCVR